MNPANSTNGSLGLCLRTQVSRTDDKDPIASGEAIESGGDVAESGVDSACGERTSSVQAIGQAIGGCGVGDEADRTRLIGDIMRLIREPSMPEGTRLAGMTLIGWLARRRTDESPHALGIEEARESERRIKAARAKTR